MKKILVGLISVFCIIGIWLGATEVHATSTNVTLYIDCDGGTCHTTNSMDLISGENIVQVGNTVSSVFNFDEDPTAVDKDFTGWYVYDKTTGQQIPGTGLLTTTQVNNYVIPNHDIKFVAQWTPRAGYPVKNITYAAFFNGEGEPCYGVKVTLIKDGISYSGYGFVSIPESIYSTWTGDIEVMWEPMEGYYIMADGKWQSEPMIYTSTVKSFLKEKSLYCSVNTTNSGREVTSPRRKVHDWYYQASFVAPEIAVLNTNTASDVISDTAVVPATYTVETEIYQSGSIYDAALNAAQTTYGTNNVVVVDIELKDENGANVTQLSDYVDVKIDIPSTYQIQAGNTVIVYYLGDDGSMEKCDTTCYLDDPDNRYVTFKTNHFSVYVLVETPVEVVTEPEAEPEGTLEEVSDNQTQETEQTTENPQGDTGEEVDDVILDNEKQDNSLIFIVAGVVFVAVVAVALLVIKRRKR